MSGPDYFLIAIALLAVAAAILERIAARRAAGQADRAAAERVALAAQRESMAAELRLAQVQRDAIGAAALGGLLLLDNQHRILWGNAAAWELFGAPRPATGQLFIALAHDVELNQAVIDAFEGQRSIVRQTAVEGRTLRIRALPLDAGVGIVVALEDVTELQRLGRARRDLVANISHDLRTPLASLGLAAQTLRQEGQHDPAMAGRMLDQIESYVQTLSQLSQEMLDLSQIESGQVLLKLVPVAVEPFLRQAAELLGPQARIRGQSLNFTAPADLMVLADEQQAARVVVNLLHNAIKFTPEGGQIELIACALDADDVKIGVRDSGPGIPTADQARVFERFYKADRARSRGGTGLGLAIARHIVEGHGGRIWVESVPGHGATFYFTLPRG